MQYQAWLCPPLCNKKQDEIRCGFVSFSKDKALGVGGRWRCIKVCIRLCTDNFEKEQRQAQSAYQPHQLAHFAANQLELASINVKQLKQTLAPYLQATPIIHGMDGSFMKQSVSSRAGLQKLPFEICCPWQLH